MPRHLRRNTGMIIAKKLIKNPVGMFQFTFPPIHLRLSGSNELWVDAKVKRGEVKVKDHGSLPLLTEFHSWVLGACTRYRIKGYEEEEENGKKGRVSTSCTKEK